MICFVNRLHVLCHEVVQIFVPWIIDALVHPAQVVLESTYGRWENRTFASGIARSVEKCVCAHRRERKVLWTKKVNGWEDKLRIVNQKVSSFVWNVKHGCLATAQFIKRSTTKINGKVQFVAKGGPHEIIHVQFELGKDEPCSGAGTYFLYSEKFPKRPICCVATRAQITGFDRLREAYSGLGWGWSCLFLTTHRAVDLGRTSFVAVFWQLWKYNPYQSICQPESIYTIYRCKYIDIHIYIRIYIHIFIYSLCVCGSRRACSLPMR